jgi:hypothetical protein
MAEHLTLETLKTLQRIAVNINTHTGEKKYRRLNLKKPLLHKASFLSEDDTRTCTHTLTTPPTTHQN